MRREKKQENETERDEAEKRYREMKQGKKATAQFKFFYSPERGFCVTKEKQMQFGKKRNGDKR